MENKFKKDFDLSLKLLARSSIIVFIGLFLSKLLAYGYRIIIARYYGPEVYGLFSLALMVVGIVTTFASLGLSQGVLRYVPLYRGEGKISWIRYIVKYSSIILLILGVISGAALYFLSGYISIQIFHNAALIIYIKIFAVLIPLNLISSLYLNLVRAYEKIGWYSFIFNVLQNIIKVASLILLIGIGINGIATALSQSLAIIGMLIAAYLVAIYCFREIYGKTAIKNGGKIMGEVLSYSLPLLLASVVYSMFYWVDSFFLGYFIDATAVGIYNVAISLALTISFVPDLFGQLFLPLITREYGKKRYEMVSQLGKQVGKWIFMLNLPIFILVIIFPGAIINILFGQQYLIAQNALRLLMTGAFVYAIFAVSQSMITVIGKSKLILINTIGATILNAILNYILIPRYGLNGAAFATMVSSIVLILIFVFESYYYADVLPIRRKMLNAFIAALIALAAMMAVKPFVEINLISIILLSAMFMLIYITIILLSGGLDENDKNILILIKNKVYRKTVPNVTMPAD